MVSDPCYHNIFDYRRQVLRSERFGRHGLVVEELGGLLGMLDAELEDE